jgi:hypothetical protein
MCSKSVLGCNMITEQLPVPSGSSAQQVLFERVDPARNVCKYYRLVFEVHAQSHEPYTVTAIWGRYYSAPRRRVWSFKDYLKFQRQVIGMCRRRISHGYRIVGYSEFPLLKPWLEVHREYFAQRTVLPFLEVIPLPVDA